MLCRVRPVLFHLGGLAVQSYGVSKALAVLVAGWLIARELARRGRDPGLAYPLTLWGAVAGFAGAKLYYLAEHAGSLSVHDLGGTGFTWYGGLIGGAGAVLLVARRRGLPARLVAGIVSAPLAFAYGIGRLGCLLAGDGTYGKPSDLPWATSFPHGTVTNVPVQPTPLHEAIVAFALGAVLLRMRDRISPTAQFATFAIVMGAARFLVEFVRINPTVAAGLSQPQLWSLALVAVGGRPSQPPAAPARHVTPQGDWYALLAEVAVVRLIAPTKTSPGDRGVGRRSDRRVRC
jgi:phosphatidylglycerol:prolipoprotein diacylglycerol transferase